MCTQRVSTSACVDALSRVAKAAPTGAKAGGSLQADVEPDGIYQMTELASACDIETPGGTVVLAD